MSIEQLKDAARESLKRINEQPEQDEFLQYEVQNEMDARQKVYDALNNEEKDRWDHIKQLLEKRDNDRIAKFNGIQLQESERVNAYFKASLMSISEFEEYLIKMIRELDLKITKYSFGRELLENFSNEKFLLLFNDGDRYSPLNLSIREYYEEKDEREIKDKLINLFAREKALLHILKNLPECPSDQSESTKEKKGKPGRKKIEVTDDFSIKDNPHKEKWLQDILKYSEIYQPIVTYLKLKGIIHDRSNKYVDGVTNKTIMPGILKVLHDNNLLNEKLTIELAESVLLNTFLFELKPDTYRRRGEIEKSHEDGINKLLSQFKFNNK